MTGFFSALGRASVRLRWPILAFWLVLLVALSVLLPSIGSEVNNDNSQFLPADAPSNVASDLAVPLLGDTNNYSQILVVAARSRPLGPADIAAIERELHALGRLPRVVRARYLGTAASGQAAEIFVNAHIAQSNVTGETRLVSRIEATFSPARPPAGLSLHVAGPVADNVADQATSAKIGNDVQALSIAFIVVLLLIIFRSLLAPLITLLPAGVALLCADRLIGELGARGLQISEVTELLLIVLLLGAGTDYGLFLVFRVREEIRGGREAREAVAFAIARVGESISASAATVIFALLTLLIASFGIYRDLGVPLALGVAIILAAGLTLLPALLAVFGRAAFFPSTLSAAGGQDGWWGTVARRVLSRPGRTLGFGVVILGALAAAAATYHPGGFAGAVNAPPGSDAAVGDAELARYFPLASANPTNLVMAFTRPVFADPQTIVRAGRVLRSSGLFSELVSPLDPTGQPIAPATFSALERRLGPPESLPPTPAPGLGIPAGLYAAYRSSAALVSLDGRTIQFEVGLRAGAPGTTPAIDAVPAVRAALERAGAAAGASAEGVAGEAPALFDVSSTSDHDLFRIVPVAILAIGLLLAVVLRSAVAPLYLILSVVLSYFAALGLASLVFIDIGGDAGLTFILPFLMFLFLLALGEDYNILVMTRIREEAHALPLRQAVGRAVGRTGPTITSAGLVLAGTFAVLSYAGSSGPGGGQIRAIGFGLSVGVLMDTFVVRTLLVPATVVLLGRLNWWPSPLASGGEAEQRPPE